MPEKDSEQSTPNEVLLKRIRERYRYGMDKWRHVREEGQKNIRYVSGDPWEQEDKNARKDRPTVCPDELNQYVNQVVNTARQNPRGIQIDPAGGEATEELAEYRENRIRAIEYACSASRVYVNGLQAAVERNLGFWKVTRAYVDDESDEQEIVILPVMNPDAILIDPDYKELDGSDIQWAFELDRMPRREFEDKYPDAEVKDFRAEDYGGSDDQGLWVDEKSVLVASYWEVEIKRRKVGKSQRTATVRNIRQYITNGAEILEEGAVQPGPYVPLIPVFGKELWVDEGGGAKRELISLVSLARDPQKAYAYVLSSMMESCGQLPKTPYIGYKGQFETDSLAWQTINTVMHPFVQVDPMVDDASGQLLPLPQRQNQAPDFQAYSVGADICRRAIMSAMGLQALPTSAQRQNQKSGVALSKIESEQSIGSYHLIDSYEAAIRLTGRVVNHWLTETDVGETKRPVREADGSHKLVQINTDAPVTVGDHTYNFPIADDKGRYQVTVSSGPSHESQREEGSDFADTLVQNLKDLPVAPPQAAQLLSLVIRLKQLGPLGDQMADIISPQNNAMAGQMAQMQQQMGVLQQQFGEQGALLQKLMLERQGKVIENQGKLAVTKMQETTKLAVAEITASKDQNEGLAERENATYHLFQEQAHELGMQAHQQAHERGMAQQQAQAQSMQSAQDAAQSQQASQIEAQQSENEPQA